MYEMGRHIHSRVLRSEKGCRIRVTHVHACSDCVYTRDDTVRLDYASRFVRVIYSSHIVSIKLGTVTPLRRCGLAVHERYDGPASMGLSALVQVSLPGGATRTDSDAATCVLPKLPACLLALSSQFFETMLSTPAWISFWRCNPHAPPISMQLRQSSPHVPRTMPRMRPTLPRRQAFLSSFGTAPRRCSDGVSHAS